MKFYEICTNWEVNSEEWWENLKEYTCGLQVPELLYLIIELIRSDWIEVNEMQLHQLLTIFQILPEWNDGLNCPVIINELQMDHTHDELITRVNNWRKE